MSAKFTPGPWSVFTIMSPAGASARIYAEGDPCIDIAHVPMEWNGDGSNAELLASAPDLLAAAELAQCPCTVWQRQAGHLIDCWMPALSAAIARAKGEPA